jgi:hypothetical protein
MDQQEEFQDAQDPQHPRQNQQPVNLNIPPFWASNPEAWFGMVEGQFILGNITQDNLRFNYVLGALPESAVRGLGDLMLGPQSPNAYKQLKTRLLCCTQAHRIPEDGKVAVRSALGGPEAIQLVTWLVQYIRVPVEDILLPLSAVAASGAAHHPLQGQGFYPASFGGESGSAVCPNRQVAP